jgi:hypothetical protein
MSEGRMNLLANLGNIPGIKSVAPMVLDDTKAVAERQIDQWAGAVTTKIAGDLPSWKSQEYVTAQTEANALLAEPDPANPVGSYPTILAAVGTTFDPANGNAVVTTMERAAEIIRDITAPSYFQAQHNIRTCRLHYQHLVRTSTTEAEIKSAIASMPRPALMSLSSLATEAAAIIAAKE